MREPNFMKGRSWTYLYIARYALIGMNDRVNLYATLLLARLWMTSHTLEYGVREQCDVCRIYDSKLLYPLFRPVASAVRCPMKATPC